MRWFNLAICIYYIVTIFSCTVPVSWNAKCGARTWPCTKLYRRRGECPTPHRSSSFAITVQLCFLDISYKYVILSLYFFSLPLSVHGRIIFNSRYKYTIVCVLNMRPRIICVVLLFVFLSVYNCVESGVHRREVMPLNEFFKDIEQRPKEGSIIKVGCLRGMIRYRGKCRKAFG